MSARDTELLEFLAKPWKTVKVTADAEESKVAVSSPCVVGRILPLLAITVTPKDDTTTLWDSIASPGLDLSTTPLEVTDSLVLDFSGAGDCFVMYK